MQTFGLPVKVPVSPCGLSRPVPRCQSWAPRSVGLDSLDGRVSGSRSAIGCHRARPIVIMKAAVEVEVCSP